MSEKDFIYCSQSACLNELPNHAWGKIKSGWFFQKDGKAWCPDHIPVWTAGWRKRKADL